MTKIAQNADKIAAYIYMYVYILYAEIAFGKNGRKCGHYKKFAKYAIANTIAISQ